VHSVNEAPEYFLTCDASAFSDDIIVPKRLIFCYSFCASIKSERDGCLSLLTFVVMLSCRLCMKLVITMFQNM